jgi:hypothetical protein
MRRFRSRSIRNWRIIFSAAVTTRRSNSWNNCSGACVKGSAARGVRTSLNLIPLTRSLVAKTCTFTPQIKSQSGAGRQFPKVKNERELAEAKEALGRPNAS